MNNRSIYHSASEAVAGMHEKGFIDDFELSGDDILWIQGKTILRANNFFVVESHLFRLEKVKGIDVLVLGLIFFNAAIKGILILRPQSIGYENLKGILVRNTETNCYSE